MNGGTPHEPFTMEGNGTGGWKRTERDIAGIIGGKRVPITGRAESEGE